MCGIIGKLDRQFLADPLTLADLERIKHRGPDDQGIYSDDHISLGHLRLSIIDLTSAGHQPMFSADRRYAIVYNGEVYNYLEIRERLKAEGVSCETQGDTEVVLKSFMHWGADCLQRFRGMFAFAIWDKVEMKLFMARDRCGEKPFIFHKNDKNFFFSSEFKGLVPLLPALPDLAPAVVDMYLHYQYAPEPFTLFEGVHKLPAAHYAVLDVKTWDLRIEEYWDLFSIKADASITREDIRAELDKAVQLTLRSDVQVGIALSAGIDSAGIAAIAAKHYKEPMQAFCVGYPGRPAYDERKEAQDIAAFLGCSFNEVELATEEFIEKFPGFALLMDEPIADIAAYGHYAVPKFCADKGIKVLLTGSGGDEVFWGYDWTRIAVAVNQKRFLYGALAALAAPFMRVALFYKLLYALSRTRKIPAPLKEFFRKLLAFVDHDAPDGQPVFMAVTGAPEFTRKYKVGESWYGPAMRSIDKNNAYVPTRAKHDRGRKDIPTSVTDLLFKTWLVGNCLSLGDRVSMAVGVETRLPLLDYRLIEKVVAWRKNRPDHGDGQKAVLRDILSDVLPPATVRRRKSGFVPPVMKWINGIARQHGPRLAGGHLVRQGIVSPDIKNLLAQENSPALLPHSLYRLILLEMWYDGMADLYGKAQPVKAAA